MHRVVAPVLDDCEVMEPEEEDDWKIAGRSAIQVRSGYPPPEVGGPTSALAGAGPQIIARREQGSSQCKSVIRNKKQRKIVVFNYSMRNVVWGP